jgi:hypothetical protein
MDDPTGRATNVYDMLTDVNEVRQFYDLQGTHGGDKMLTDLMEGQKSARAFLKRQHELCDRVLKRTEEAKTNLELYLARHDTIDEMVAFGIVIKQGRRPESIDIRHLQAIFTRNQIHPQFSSIQTITEHL